MAFFNKGDFVTVRPDLRLDATYLNQDGFTSDAAVDEMVSLAGQTVEILEVLVNGKYHVDMDSGREWNWTDEMFVEYLERDKPRRDEPDVELQSHDEFLAFLAG